MLALSITNMEEETVSFVIEGVLTVSGSYATGGDPLDFTKATFANQGLASGILPAAIAPIYAELKQAPAGYVGEWTPAAVPTLQNGKLKWYSAAGTELSAGAYPASITGDTQIIFAANFKKFQ